MADILKWNFLIQQTDKRTYVQYFSVVSLHEKI